MHAEKLMRRQILIYPRQIAKLEQLARQQNVSAAELVRKAIDAYNPGLLNGMEESELLDLVSVKVKEAIKDTRRTRVRLAKALDQLKAKGA